MNTCDMYGTLHLKVSFVKLFSFFSIPFYSFFPDFSSFFIISRFVNKKVK